MEKKYIWNGDIYRKKITLGKNNTFKIEIYIRKNLYSKKIIQNGTYTKKEYI